MKIYAAGLALALCFAPAAVWAQEIQLELGKESSIEEALVKLTGKSVILKTIAGQELGGIVVKSNDEAVILTSVTGKEYYDALIRLDSIEAIMVRTKK